MHKQDAIEMCKQHMHKYVLIHTSDGMQYDGIVVDLDDEHVILAVPVGAAELTPPQVRAFYGYPGYGFPGYGFGYPYYGPYGYGGRFRRLALPLAALTAISLLPYF